jgi:hypothetical protein
MSRFLIPVLLLSFNATAATVDSAKIKATFTKLAKLAESSEAHATRASRPRDMLRELHLRIDNDPESFTFRNFGDGYPGADELKWGIATMRSAIDFVRNSYGLGEDHEGRRTPDRAEKAADLVKELVGTGVVFGYSPNGAVQCGVTLPSLLLIDTARRKVYQLTFDGSGC